MALPSIAQLAKEAQVSSYYAAKAVQELKTTEAIIGFFVTFCNS
jgi:DNA-binding transcriptional regulator YhcF (GntR family)